MITTVLVFLIILSLLVFVHEMGHFFTAKKLGMKVDEFGFGFPPRIFGIRRVCGEKRQLVEETEDLTVTVTASGENITDIVRDTVEVRPTVGWKLIWGSKEQCEEETVYSINWIPLGGFVKIHGESGNLKQDPRSFASRPVWQRFVVLIAGVFMNFVFAALLLSIGFGLGLPTIVDETVSLSAKLNNEKVQIMSVAPESPAAAAGVETGDEVLSVDGQIFVSANEARDYIKSREGQSLDFVLKRGEDTIPFSLTATNIPSYEGMAIGVGLVKTALVSYPWYLAAIKGVEATCVFTWEVLKAFGNLLWNLITYQGVSAELSGPVGIAVMTGEAASLGLVYLLQFAAVLSINLAVVNILPFPALDGGRLLFLMVEKIRGRAVHEKWETLVHNLGFIVLILLIAVVTVRDLFKFGG